MKKTEQTALAVVDEQNAALAALGIDVNDRRGKENIGADDVKPSFLKIAQKMSDELEPSHAKYLEDLRANQLFNTETGEIYGSTVEIIVIALRKHAIQFEDAERGLTFERNVPWNDPRCEFGKDGEKPQAIRYYDFATLVLPKLEPVITSMKVTNIDTAKALNGRLMKLAGPTFAYKFTLGVRTETRNVKGKDVTFGVFDVLDLKNPKVVTPEQFKIAQKAYESATAYLEKADHSVVDGEVFGGDREPGSDDM
jgi:hypothetical protein